jgi:hypothetical protein
MAGRYRGIVSAFDDRKVTALLGLGGSAEADRVLERFFGALNA